jgi:hypothetical protein
MPFLQTPKLAFEFARKAVTANDTAITTFDFESMPSALLWTPGGKGYDHNFLTFAAFGEGTENGTAKLTIFGRAINGPVIKVAEVTVTLGTHSVTKNPITKEAEDTAKWFDSASITDYWIKTVGGNTGGSNLISLFGFDVLFLKDFYVEVTDMTNVTEVNVIVTGA